MPDANGATITGTLISGLLPPHPLAAAWSAAGTTDAKLLVIAKAMGIVV